MNTMRLHKIGDIFVKNSPTILTGVSVAGLITTTILAVKATPKAIQILDDYYYETQVEDKEYEPLPKKDIIKLTYKCYIPAVIVGGVSIACIIASNTINSNRYAALAGVYSLTEKAFKEYQDKVVETIGKEKARDIKDEVIKDKMKNHPSNDKEVIFTGYGDTLCYDSMSGRYFKSDRETIREAINNMNRNMMSQMSISLNEVYYAIGLDGIRIGDSLGWHVDSGLVEIRFDSQLTADGKPCLVLDFETDPRYINFD